MKVTAWHTIVSMPLPLIIFGNVWAGTDGGLSRLNPATGQIQNFYVQHGLPDNEILQLAIAPSGELYIATQAAWYRYRQTNLSLWERAADYRSHGFRSF